MSSRSWMITATVGWTLACGWIGGAEEEPDDEATGTEAAAGVSEDPGDPPTGAGGAPSILSIATNVSRITEGEWVTITAIVTDPDGIDDLIGGELLAADGSSYGVFDTSAQEGAYEITVGWDDLDVIDPITFEGEDARDVLARFYDAGGNTAQSLLTIELFCDEGAACYGRCLSLDDDPDNCGACGYTCSGEPDWFEPTCSSGACVVASDCTTAVQASCDEVCDAQGLGPCTAAETGWGDATTQAVSFGGTCAEPNEISDDDCAEPIGAIEPGTPNSARCTCAE